MDHFMVQYIRECNKSTDHSRLFKLTKSLFSPNLCRFDPEEF